MSLAPSTKKAPMLLPVTCSDSEIEANAAVVAAGILAHPARLLLASTAVATLATIANREPPSSASPQECRLLHDAVTLVDAVEIRLGQEKHA